MNKGVTKVMLFFTHNHGLTGRIISYVTCPLSDLFKRKMHTIPSHCGIGFFDVDKDDWLLFEAQYGMDWRGPFSMDELADWVDTGEGRWTHQIVLPEISILKAKQLFQKAKSRLGIWDYAYLQCGFLYLWKRLRIPMVSSAKVTCSEAVGRLLYPVMDLRKLAHVNKFDCLTPVNIYRGLKNSNHLVTT